ncbi:MAG: ZIP family metal transporter [Gemmatimonadota bacterium]|nr:ZIP family metal transporter [Gemmatimonadota bacterium]
MSELEWIVLGGVAMTAIALVGSVTLVFDSRTLERLLLPLVGLAAGSLLGGALFHMLPEAVDRATDPLRPWLWAALGFTAFYALEQLLHGHHRHSAAFAGRQPVTYLILIADGLHNFLGGLAVASAFLTDIRLGVTTWLVAAAHEVPQELGDFGVLVHGGWSHKKALLVNALSGATFLVGGLIAYAASRSMAIDFVLPFAAGNFLYIAAADLVPETNRPHGPGAASAATMGAFLFGAGLLYLLAVAVHG